MRFIGFAAIMFLSIASAEAASYTYAPVTITDRDNQQLNASDLIFDLSISDAALATGMFNYAYSNNPSGPLRQGDVAEFQSFIVPAFLISAQGSATGMYQLDISFNFDSSDQVSNGFLYYQDDGYSITLSGDSGDFNGIFMFGSVSDINNVTGSIVSQVSVPEPSGLGTLGLVLALIFLARLTRRQNCLVGIAAGCSNLAVSGLGPRAYDLTLTAPVAEHRSG